MTEVGTLQEIPLDDAPDLDSWLDLSSLAEGFDVLARPGEVVLIVHMPEGVEHMGLSFDPEGAVALAAALTESAKRAYGYTGPPATLLP
jgi:hypothetical protein